MSSSFKIFGIIVLSITLLVTLYSTFSSRAESEANAVIRDQTREAANELMDCYYQRPASYCFSQHFYKKGRSVTLFSNNQDNINSMKESLGKRIKTKLDLDSWNINNHEEHDGIYSDVNFKMISEYEGQNQVVEEYSLVKAPEDSHYRIKFFNVDY